MLTLLIYTVFIQWPVQIFCWAWQLFLKLSYGVVWIFGKCIELALRLIGKMIARIAPKLGAALIELGKGLISIMKSFFNKANKRVKELLEKTKRNNESPILENHSGSNADSVDGLEAAEEVSCELEEEFADLEEVYMSPPLSLLDTNNIDQKRLDREIADTAALLTDVLRDLNHPMELDEIVSGVRNTRFDYKLKNGLRLSELRKLNNDICTALDVKTVAINPAPRKSGVVAFEVPNRSIKNICLQDILGSDEFNDALSPTTVAIGKDDKDDIVIADLAEMPHMLIGGTTGTGKSTLMHSIIMSLLYKSRPDDLRLILIDTKSVEFSLYSAVPHLLVPVCTTRDRAASNLEWIAKEVKDRLSLFTLNGTRDFEDYNCRTEKKMQRLIVVIDEMYDLMSGDANSIADSITKIVRDGKKAGIHIVIGSYRPSAKMIPGEIKVCIPCRVAFACTSSRESIMVLGQGGAETLSNLGDMLFLSRECSDPRRIRGCSVSVEEITRVCHHFREQPPHYYRFDSAYSTKGTTKGTTI